MSTRARVFQTLAAVLAAWLALALTSCARQLPGQKPEQKVNRKVELKLRLASNSYLVGEDLNLTVSVINGTSSEIQIPDPFHRDNTQPVYRIQGPSYPDGRSFTFRSAVLKETDLAPEGLEPILIQIPAGQSVEHDVPLHSWAPATIPGEYELTASLNWNGLSAQAPPIRFRIARAETVSASVGVDVEADGSPGEWVEWFHNEGGSRRLYTALFKRPHTDVHGYSPLGVDGIFTAQSSASDLLSPWTNYNRMAELYKWRAWREGAALVGLISGSGVPQRIELGGIPQRVIRPALMDSTGRLDIFFLNAVGDLGFARFPAPKSGAAAPGKVLWRAQLATGEFITARAALAPQQAGGGRYLANASQVANAVAVSLMRLGDAQQAQPWQSGRVPNAYGLPQCEPALRVAQDGAVHFSLLVALDKSRKQIALADVTFGPGDKPPVSRVMPLGQMPGIPQAGAVSFTVAPGVPVQREWFLLFDANEYRRSGDEGDPKTLGVNPIVPVEMIVQAAGTYILGLGDQGQPKFQVLE